MLLIQCIDSIIRSLDNINWHWFDEQVVDSATAFCKNLSIGVESDFNRHHLKLLIPKRYDENKNTQINFQFYLFYRTEFKGALYIHSFDIV